ncbi:hypothetical protein KIPB_003193 [Kipferlia bialata]|uniref:Uncharacterized protein n=1 Tax=Kipferlia bialata TaxID=797122 RepID=A0A9K3GH07_9EUKA|nr:hypothetical protein KIPB_003193 [Kipferlia bialata]|eukprot:g3193.t1
MRRKYSKVPRVAKIVPRSKVNEGVGLSVNVYIPDCDVPGSPVPTPQAPTPNAPTPYSAALVGLAPTEYTRYAQRSVVPMVDTNPIYEVVEINKKDGAVSLGDMTPRKERRQDTGWPRRRRSDGTLKGVEYDTLTTRARQRAKSVREAERRRPPVDTVLHIEPRFDNGFGLVAESKRVPVQFVEVSQPE